MFAVAAAVLSIAIAAPAAAQSLDIRPSDRIFDPATGLPTNAYLYYNDHGARRFLVALELSQRYCGAGNVRQPEYLAGLDVDVDGSARRRGRGSSIGGRFDYDPLEAARQRREAVREAADDFRRDFCSDLSRLERRLD